jgi:autotransporter-associated beta strand protein
MYNTGGKVVSTGDVQNLISAEVHFAGTHAIEVNDGAAEVDLLANNRLSHHHGTLWGGITKTGAGTFQMTCPTNAIAGTALNGGRVIFSNGALGWPDTPANKSGYYLADFAGTTVLTWNDGNTQDITTNGNLRIQDAATAILDTGTNNVQFARPIVTAGAGTGSLAKAGSGTLTLHATNTYSGSTIVSNGTLLVQGQLAGSVAVVGGTLGGTGVVLGAVTSGGTVAPGASAGQFLIAGDYTQNAPGTLSIELGGGAPGVTYDELLVGGTANLAGGLKVRLIDGFTPATNDLFLILDANVVAGTFTSSDLPTLPAGQGWEILYLSGEVLLSITSAPAISGYDLAATVITNGLTGYNDDADGDGYANLLEYVTGGSLTNADTTARMNGGRTNGVLALKFFRDGTATDATLYVEGSYTATNGADWVGIATNLAGSWGGSTNVTEVGAAPINVTVQDSEASATNRFLRLRVTRP